MPLPRHIQARVDQLMATMPKQPIRDGVIAHAGRERAEIAELFHKAGDETSASLWYLEAARFCHASGDLLGAIALVKRSIKTHPSDAARELYRSLWALLGLGETPDPIE